MNHSGTAHTTRPLAEDLAHVLRDGKSVVVTGLTDTFASVTALAAELSNSGRTRVLQIAPPLDLPSVMRQLAPKSSNAPASSVETLHAILTQIDEHCDRIVLIVASAQELPVNTLRYLEFALVAGARLSLLLAGDQQLDALLALPGFSRLSGRLTRITPTEAIPAQIDFARLSIDVPLAPRTRSKLGTLTSAGGRPGANADLKVATRHSVKSAILFAAGATAVVGLVVLSRAPQLTDPTHYFTQAISNADNGSPRDPPTPAMAAPGAVSVMQAAVPALSAEPAGSVASFPTGALSQAAVASIDPSLAQLSVTDPMARPGKVSPVQASALAEPVAPEISLTTGAAPETAVASLPPPRAEPSLLDLAAAVPHDGVTDHQAVTAIELSALPIEPTAPLTVGPVEDQSESMASRTVGTVDAPLALPPRLPPRVIVRPAPSFRSRQYAALTTRPAEHAAVNQTLRPDSERCRSIVMRVQLGEDANNADQIFLRNGCH